MLSNMQWLATESPDHRVRLAATKMLHDIADERLKREQRTVNVDRLISDIQELSPAAPKPELELESATEPSAESAATDSPE